ncbi:MAG TPA: hypothetical protein VFM75_10630 [Modicisalibacter sp.]|nr:hypothetical protein [Modicisalibacter sp.]
MAKSFDTLRVLAIASQAAGFIAIIALETLMGDAARPWQGMTLALMLGSALWVALLRRYRRNRQRKVATDKARREVEDETQWEMASGCAQDRESARSDEDRY